MTADGDRLARAGWIGQAALDRKAERLIALDVRELTSYADTFILATGTSDRHVRSIADAIVEAASARGEKPLGTEGYDEARWVLIDLADVIVHVFRAEVREEYDLERLWNDAAEIQLEGASAATEGALG